MPAIDPKGLTIDQINAIATADHHLKSAGLIPYTEVVVFMNEVIPILNEMRQEMEITMTMEMASATPPVTH